MSEIEIAKQLEALWIERERKQRMKHPMSKQTKEPITGTLESDATKQCRVDLQRAFGLVRETREGEEIGYKTGWYRKPTDYTR